MVTSRAKYGSRQWTFIFLAWLPFAIGYPLSIAASSDNPSVGYLVGVRSAMVWGVMTASIWWLISRWKWLDATGVRFYVLHVIMSLVFAGAWWIIVNMVGSVSDGRNVASGVRFALANRFAIWNVVFASLAYGLIAGTYYGVRGVDRAREAAVRAAEAREVAQRAQLSALQARLNPHFLFNTLHSLGELIREDQDAARHAVTSLGLLLRYALDTGKLSEVLLAEEWEFTQNYLRLEQTRMGDRLRVATRIDEKALPRQVPPFCLQPLVENAIRHGLDPLPDGGTVEIALRAELTNTVLEVRDDGAGASMARLASTAGTGIDTLEQRLRAWEDEPGSVTCHTSPGAGFHATVVLPHHARPADDVKPGSVSPIQSASAS